MKESNSSKGFLKVMFGFLFIGGGAALLGIYRASKTAEVAPGFLVQENDGEIFVCGAYA